MNQSSIFLIGENSNNFTTFPEEIYVDTCFWNQAYGTSNSNNNYSSYCSNFLVDCATNLTTIYTSGLVKEELIHVIKRETIKQVAKDNNVQFPTYPNGSINIKELLRRVKSVDNKFDNNLNEEITRVLNIIDSVTEYLPYEHDEEFDQDLLNLLHLSQYNIDTQDAKHILISHMYGINNIATVDGDFAALDNLNIFAPPTLKYKSEHKKRENTYNSFDEDKY